MVMSAATFFIVRVYRQGQSPCEAPGEGVHGIAENAEGEQFPFHTMEELWRVLRAGNGRSPPRERH